jgi:hypothetical protein
MIVNLKNAFRCFLASALVTACLSSSVLADNLLVNSDFKLGTPGEADFAWDLELAKEQKSEAVVVEGRQPGTTAICLRHDELGGSEIRQKIQVQPWRWYFAQMWVNSERMAAFGFSPSINLEGGRSVAGVHFHDDTFQWPKKGWRRLQVIAHSGDRDTITLHMGGDQWSGELLFAEPVVRECSIVEAASYYPSVSNRHPSLYGPPLDPERNQHGYAFQTGDVCRVAPGYPNPLVIIGQMNAKAPEGRIALALPPGVRFRKHQDSKTTPTVTEMPNGFQRVELPPEKSEVAKLLVDTDLEPGEEAVGYVQFEWKGGFQVPTPVRFKGIALPDVPAPKRAMVSLGINVLTPYHWDDDQEAMVRSLKRFGFNHIETWGGDARRLHRDGMHGVTAFGGGFEVDREKNPEAVAVTFGGNRDHGLMSPSYRGPAMQPFIDRVKDYAKTTSAVTLDDETCLMSSMSPGIGFHPRTIDRWNQWVAEHEPELAGVDPKVFGRRPHKYRKHYDAWLHFRCELVAERYAILREAFHKAVEESGVKTTERTMLGAYVIDDPLVSLHSNKALALVLDYVANMVYKDGEGVREAVARLAPVTGKKLVIAISPGYQISPPGDARSQVLEAVMGGSQGVLAWGYYMGMTTGHLADMSDAVKMFGPVEDVILDGTIQDGYSCETDSVNLLARKLGDVRVLLVSDYSPRPRRAIVTVPGDTELEVADLFTDQVVARLDSRNRNFSATLRRDFAARLYRLQPPKQK